jgi:hypothetical protein
VARKGRTERLPEGILSFVTEGLPPERTGNRVIVSCNGFFKHCRERAANALSRQGKKYFAHCILYGVRYKYFKIFAEWA